MDGVDISTIIITIIGIIALWTPVVAMRRIVSDFFTKTSAEVRKELTEDILNMKKEGITLISDKELKKLFKG